MTASGTFGYGSEFAPYMDLNKLGAIVVKGLSLYPRQGNPGPRIVETPSGMLNAIGLQNVGVDDFIERKLPLLKGVDTHVIANIFGETVEDYVEVARRLDAAKGVAALEINISCPNVKKGGIVFGTDPNEAFKVVSAVRKATRLPVITKLSPNVTDIKVMVKAAEDGGSDAISLINTITGMAIDVERRRPVLATATGGLSGPAIRPIAVRMVWQAAQVAKVPIIGMGGIVTAKDALEFIIAGATAVQVGTANFIEPDASVKVVDGIEEYLVRKNMKLEELIGSLRSG
ncbi:MAG: dihydroorotate dehydrogenase B catalytic subunit [Deltaproteobacteria bacterium GWC2_55_46]|nr:MAG: dihydroorotate dehydrogenase B catalytic subunit [Deltaproteobacteria bacterium GWA2_55_82]OGQ62744.1 MAG: dihydroorotate dehydrogenase B catalytic subunit [Deltaproteobacteria bacterium RIFCSPLOWO2_02_FULL_55_12]OIJ75122.1 MAG: dihydroorotate dehydrogenase B catalytic subunit [Deltaproteobacteria bacterium GWC2_55_46]